MIHELKDFIQLSKKHIPIITELFVQSFHDNPYFLFLMPDESERKKSAPWIFRYLVKNGIKYGKVYATSPEIEGVFIWYPPGQHKQSLWKQLRSGAFKIYTKVGKDFIKRYLSISKKRELKYGHLYPSRYIYLALGAMKPENRGKSYASNYARAMCAYADRINIPLVANTNIEKNFNMSEHLGFELIEKFNLPDTDLPNYLMIRYPKST